MKKNHTLIIRRSTAACLGLLAVAFTISPASVVAQCDPPSRCFYLYLVNQTAQPVTFTIVPGSCYEGTGCCGQSRVLGPVPPGGRATNWIARIQGHGCDGANGSYAIQPSTHGGEFQNFTFDNSGELEMTSKANAYDGLLSAKSPVDGSYTWVFREVVDRLSGPVDERLTMPRNYIAADSGRWNLSGGTRWDDLRMVNTGAYGTSGNFYDSCVGVELFHPQHVVRLPNKNGRAYFMVAQSRAHNGYIQVMRTDADMLDPVTDLVRSVGRTTRVGEYIWMDIYTGIVNAQGGGSFNPIGNWNHPGKLALMGGVLVVAAQNWEESAPCFYGRGTSQDALLFYDVRNPEQPRYWGKMLSSELGVSEISGVGLIRNPATDAWILSVYGNGVTTFWQTTSVSPIVSRWTRVTSGGPAGQHGMEFNSYQTTTPRMATSPANGVERVMFYDEEGDPTGFSFTEYLFNPSTSTFASQFASRYNLAFPQADRHWDSDSTYVTRLGVPVVYTMESSSQYGDTGILIQTYDTNNFTLRTPHPDQVVTTLADSGPGSLRRAIGYGGNITFAPNLNSGTINVTSGPFLVHLYDVNIDASALISGITINGNSTSPVFKVASGTTFTHRGLNAFAWATGDPVGWFDQTFTTRDGNAFQTGRISHNQQTYLEAPIRGPGTLTFWWKVSSERNLITGSVYDYLRFTLDGTQLPSAPGIAGEVDWQQQTVPVPAGHHMLRWTYTKDNSDGLVVGADAGWLDQVVYTPAVATVVSTTTDSGPGSLRQVIADVPAGTVITFVPNLSGQTIVLGGTQLLLNKNLTIDASALPGGVSISGNNAARAFEIAGGTTVTMNRLTITRGNATLGGGIRNSGTLLLNQSSLLNNSSSGRGGAVYNLPAGILTVNNSTVAGNTATDIGGGLVNEGSLTLVNSTLAGNTTAAAGGGGGIFNFGVPLSLSHCTLSGNSATGPGGGLRTQGGTVSITNNIIAGNTSQSQGPDIGSFNGTTFVIGGNNLIGDNSTVTAQFPAGPLVGTTASPRNPRLAPLNNYGDSTRTMPLLPGSPAIDGAIVLAGTPATDQRGVSRPSGSGPDLGAVEAFPFSTLPLVDTDGDGIDDRLEPAYGLVVGVNNSATDSDGDGSPDGEELFNMTDPLNPADYLHILSFTRAAGFDPVTNSVFDVAFNSFPGLAYELETGSTLPYFAAEPGTQITATTTKVTLPVLLHPDAGFVRVHRGHTRWAARVLGFSSEYTSDAWSAAQALGRPDTYPAYGDIPTAWASVSQDDQPEFLELGFDAPAPINSISIYETYSPGAVNKVSVRNPNTGLWVEVWSGPAAPAGDASRIFNVKFPLTSFPVDAIRVDLNSPAVPGWNEIDAVGIITGSP